MKMEGQQEQADGTWGGEEQQKQRQTVSMEIPLCLAGWVIGRKGCRVQAIQTATNCILWLDQSVPDDQPRVLYIEGFPEDIECAMALVKKLLGSSPLVDGAAADGSAGQGGQPPELTTAIVDCPADMLGLLIGRSGWTLKKIVRESGANITINNNTLFPLQPRRIIIYGLPDKVRMAEAYIHRILYKEDVMGSDSAHPGGIMGQTPGHGQGQGNRGRGNRGGGGGGGGGDGSSAQSPKVLLHYMQQQQQQQQMLQHLQMLQQQQQQHTNNGMGVDMDDIAMGGASPDQPMPMSMSMPMPMPAATGTHTSGMNGMPIRPHGASSAGTSPSTLGRGMHHNRSPSPRSSPNSPSLQSAQPQISHMQRVTALASAFKNSLAGNKTGTASADSSGANSPPGVGTPTDQSANSTANSSPQLTSTDPFAANGSLRDNNSFLMQQQGGMKQPYIGSPYTPREPYIGQPRPMHMPQQQQYYNQQQVPRHHQQSQYNQQMMMLQQQQQQHHLQMQQQQLQQQYIGVPRTMLNVQQQLLQQQQQQMMQQQQQQQNGYMYRGGVADMPKGGRNAQKKPMHHLNTQHAQMLQQQQQQQQQQQLQMSYLQSQLNQQNQQNQYFASNSAPAADMGAATSEYQAANLSANPASIQYGTDARGNSSPDELFESFMSKVKIDGGGDSQFDGQLPPGFEKLAASFDDFSGFEGHNNSTSGGNSSSNNANASANDQGNFASSFSGEFSKMMMNGNNSGAFPNDGSTSSSSFNK